MAGWMINANDPAREEIAQRALTLGITGSPDQAVHHLGEITLADGTKVAAHVVHAVDPIITDGDEVVMINRSNEPGKGKPALPGGFIDPTKGGGIESAVQAAAREAMEEVGITLHDGTLVGTRNMNRPFDVRVAQKPLPQYDIAQGDIFMVSTQAVRFDVPDLKNTKLVAGDDALPGSARRVQIATLNKESVGISDHFDMIKEALPEQFTAPTIWAGGLGKKSGRDAKAQLPVLAQIAKEAGAKVASMRADILADKKWVIKEDGSPVTEADKAANKLICQRLNQAFPSIPIVSEENTPEENHAALQAPEYFNTDPLDNTNAYISDKWNGYSVNIGHIKNGVPIAGAIYFPEMKELYFTGDNGKAYVQHEEKPPVEIKVKGLPLRTPLKAAVGYNEKYLEHLGDRPYEASTHAGQYRTCMVAKGECDITGINKGYGGGFESWDTAGPHAVLLAAGGDIVTRDGEALRYGNTTKLPDHIAGGNDVLVALGLSQNAKASNKGIG